MGGGRVSWEGGWAREVGKFHGKGGWVSVGIFLTAFIPPGLGLSARWELVEAQLGWVRGAPPNPVTEGVCGDVSSHPHLSDQGFF